MPTRSRRPSPEGDALDPVLCSCGAVLADGHDGESIILDGEHYPFRRTTDHLLCRECFQSTPIREIVEELDEEDDPPAYQATPDDAA